MSNAIFPTLAGIAAERDHTATFDNVVRRSASGKRFALGKRLYPVWTFRLRVNVLRQNAALSETELDALEGFFLQRKGDLDSFLYQDRERNAVTTPQAFGVGDGTERTFRLVHNRGGFIDRVGYVPASGLVVRANAVATTAFTRDDNANLTFTTAPGAGVVLDWTGSFYFRVVFAKPAMTFSQFLKDMYSVSGVELETDNQ